MKSVDRQLIALFIALCAAACGTNQGDAAGNRDVPGASGSSGPGASSSGGGAGQGPNSGMGTVKLTLKAK